MFSLQALSPVKKQQQRAFDSNCERRFEFRPGAVVNYREMGLVYKLFTQYDDETECENAQLSAPQARWGRWVEGGRAPRPCTILMGFIWTAIQKHHFCSRLRAIQFHHRYYKKEKLLIFFLSCYIRIIFFYLAYYISEYRSMRKKSNSHEG